MKTVLKFLAVAITIIIILIILGFVSLHFLMSSKNVKNMLEKQVKQQTGRTLTINKLSWSMFPTLRVEISGATLGNAKNFGTQPFAKLAHINVGVKLLPLLHHEIMMTGVTIKGLSLNLQESKNGANNWSSFAGITQHPKVNAAATSVQPTQQQQQTTATKTNTKNKPVIFQLPSINIKNINVSYVSKKTNKSFHLSNLNFTADNIQNAKPFDFKANMNFSTKNPYSKVIFNTAGQIILAPNQDYFKIQHVNIHSDITKNKQEMKLTISDINATINTAKNNQIIIQPVTAQLYNGTFEGNSTINFNDKPTSLTLNGDLNGVDAKAALSDVYGYDKFTGTGSEKLHLTLALGAPKGQATRYINGSGSFDFKNAQFQGFDLGYMYQSAVALVTKGKQPTQNSKVTKFGDIHGQYKITRGILSLKVLKFLSPILQIKGKGTANLNNQKLNLKLVVTGMKGSVGNLQTNGPDIPFNVTGNFKHQKITPDLTDLLTAAATSAIGQQIGNVLGGNKKGKNKGLNLKNLNLHKLLRN